MLDLLEILDASLAAPSCGVLNDAALNEWDIVGMDVCHWLDW